MTENRLVLTFVLTKIQNRSDAATEMLFKAFLSELDGSSILQHLEEKVDRNELLTDEELMEIIILPLSYRKKQEKEKRIQETVDLAVRIQDRGQQVFALAGILAFTDKVIDRETANKIRRAIEMTQVAMIFEEEKQQAVQRAVEAERKKAAEEAAVETMKAIANRMLKEGKLKVGEVAEFFPDLSGEDVEKIEGKRLK